MFGHSTQVASLLVFTDETESESGTRTLSLDIAT